jgi:hypothetical protein
MPLPMMSRGPQTPEQQSESLAHVRPEGVQEAQTPLRQALSPPKQQSLSWAQLPPMSPQQNVPDGLP